MSKYSVISEKRRHQLIQLVKKEKKTIVSAAKKLKIKISTAKSILYSFQRNGKVLKKRKHQKIQKTEDCIQEKLQQNVQHNINSPTQQIKKQEEKNQSLNIQNPKVEFEQLYVMNPPFLNPLWSYYQMYNAYNQFPFLNRPW